MGEMQAPHEMSATEAAAAMRAGSLTSEELVLACLQRISEREDEVGAWAYLDEEVALSAARARDAGPSSGPLHGVPVGIKDIMDTRDLPTSHGSSIYAGNQPDDDAECVGTLRSAGGVVLGKTATTEFALFHPAKTRNPHDLARTPGGSSSGSAAAVADRMVPLALGTQTAGSIIRPAAYCGIFGYKPTAGSVPLTGVKPVAPSLDTIGGFTRTGDDLVLLARALGVDVTDVTVPDRPRVGVIRADWDRAVEDAAARVIDDALQGLRGIAEVVDLPFNDEAAGLVEAQSAIMDAEAAVSLARERERYAAQLSPLLRERLEAGESVHAEQLATARALAERCRGRADSLLASCDVVVATAATGEPPDSSSTGDPVLCRPWTLLGVPAVAVPGLTGPTGLPLGIQVLAPRRADSAVIGAARWLADALGT